jgi:hypothetical protein
MTRKITFTWIEGGVLSVAELLQEGAPETCNAIWNALERPVEILPRHAMFAGPEINLPLPKECQVFDPRSLPDENLEIFPQAGDVLWHHFPQNIEFGPHPEVYNVSVIYGRGARMLLPAGWVPHSVFAIVTENLEGFAAMAREVRKSGTKTVRLARLEV